MTQTATTKEQLTAERTDLINKLREGDESIFPLLEANDLALKQLARVDLLKQVNAKYTRIREFAKQAFECEQPTEDITCGDGSFHKTKIKKYPKIAALPYCYANWEDGRITRLTINGEKFTMYQTKYEHGKETEYTRPETFSAFLELNHIPENDITIEQYNDICEKLNVLNNQLKQNIDRYQSGLRSLNYYSLSCWGLISQHNVNLYEYTPNR